MRSIPIFIISYNRGDYLKRVVASYHRQSVPVEIIVHDFGSTDPETLAILSELEESGAKVVRAGRIFSGADLGLVDNSVQEYFRDAAAPSRYVVTDCDIDLTIASAESLSIYNELLDRFPDAECVGPMLRVTDIPKDFPLYNRVMNRHIYQFWRHEPEWYEAASGARVAFLRAYIDSTFALHRENTAFRREKVGIRIYFPYEAQHLDWYQSPEDLAASAYYQASFQGIGNWSNKMSHEKFAAEELEYTQLICVEPGADGRPERRDWFLSDALTGESPTK